MEQSGNLSLYGQPMPYSLEAEQSVLGAILLDPGCLSDVLEYLRPESFYRPQHQELFALMVRMFTAAQAIDLVTVLDEVKREEIFPSPEEAKLYLTQLAQAVPTTSNAASYARIVQEKYFLRGLITVGREMADQASDGQADPRLLIDAAEQRLFEIREGKENSGLVRVDRILMETYDHLQKLSGEDRKNYMGLSTGFSALDAILTGLNKSDLILLAARPAMGKTAFALNIAAHVAIRGGKTVAIFSLEMSAEQLVNRILCFETPIQGMQLRTGNLKSEDWAKLAETSQYLSEAPLYIDDTSSITVAEMKAKLRRLKNLGLVVIDYLQLMSGGSRNSNNRVQEVSEITRSLKSMAKELDVPVLPLSQLSRGPESRADHRPMLSDLRESGSIEQDADIVLFLYREFYYDQTTDAADTAECIIAKNRHGEVGTVPLGWDRQYTRFRSMELFRDEG